jgi:hypothetical protein
VPQNPGDFAFRPEALAAPLFTNALRKTSKTNRKKTSKTLKTQIPNHQKPSEYNQQTSKNISKQKKKPQKQKKKKKKKNQYTGRLVNTLTEFSS